MKLTELNDIVFKGSDLVSHIASPDSCLLSEFLLTKFEYHFQVK